MLSALLCVGNWLKASKIRHQVLETSKECSTEWRNYGQWKYRCDNYGNWDVTSASDVAVPIKLTAYWFDSVGCAEMRVLKVTKASEFSKDFKPRQLHTITFDDHLVSLGAYAFEGTSVSEVSFGKNFESWEYLSFSGCEVTTIDLRQSPRVTYLEHPPSSLRVLHLPVGEDVLGVEIPSNWWVPDLVTITGGESIEKIGRNGLGWSNLKELTLTDRVTSIGTDALAINGLTLTYIGSKDWSNGDFFGSASVKVIVTRDYPSDTFGGVKVTKPLSGGQIFGIIVLAALGISAIGVLIVLFKRGIIKCPEVPQPIPAEYSTSLTSSLTAAA